jgi:hypothetical protein
MPFIFPSVLLSCGTLLKYFVCLVLTVLISLGWLTITTDKSFHVCSSNFPGCGHEHSIPQKYFCSSFPFLNFCSSETFLFLGLPFLRKISNSLPSCGRFLLNHPPLEVVTISYFLATKNSTILAFLPPKKCQTISITYFLPTPPPTPTPLIHQRITRSASSLSRKHTWLDIHYVHCIACI